VAGSAFTYTLVTFGEFPAYITMGMLLLQYVVAMAAVGQGFSQYLALLCNQSATLFVIETGVGVDIDIMAFGVILVLSLALTFGVRESATFINIVTVAKLVLIVFICIMGYVYSQPGTFSSQFTLHQKGTDGIFQGAAIIMFAYVAFDAVCNAVEEVRTRGTVHARVAGSESRLMVLGRYTLFNQLYFRLGLVL